MENQNNKLQHNNNNSSINLNNSLSFGRIHSHKEMGELELESSAILEFEDASLENSGSVARKNHSFKEGSHINIGLKECTKCRNSPWNSIRLVVFSTKLNILMIFRPLAILVDKFAGHPGKFPELRSNEVQILAERIGFGTESLKKKALIPIVDVFAGILHNYTRK